MPPNFHVLTACTMTPAAHLDGTVVLPNRHLFLAAMLCNFGASSLHHLPLTKAGPILPVLPILHCANSLLSYKWYLLPCLSNTNPKGKWPKVSANLMQQKNKCSNSVKHTPKIISKTRNNLLSNVCTIGRPSQYTSENAPCRCFVSK